MTLRRIPFLFTCICALMLAGCGFHPRAELVVPSSLGPVQVVAIDPYSPLGDSLSRILTRAGATPATVAPGCKTAVGTVTNGSALPAVAGCAHAKVTTLRIVSEKWEQSPLSVNAFAQVREYLITYTVKFSFVDADGNDISALQEVKLQRDYIYDDAHALGAADEQQTIHQELQHDMAATIIRRITIALRHYTSTPTQ